jgi:hypothetical protein
MDSGLGLDLGLEAVGVEDEPQEACQFTSDSDDGFGAGFAAGDEPDVTTVEARLSAIGDGDDTLGLTLAAAFERKADRGPVAIVPGGLDEETADVVVAGAGDRAPSTGLAAGVFAGDEAEVAHEGTWRPEAAEVVEFGDEADGGDGVDAAEAAEPGDGFLVRFLGGEFGEGRVDVLQTLLEFVDGDEIRVERGLAGAIVEGEGVKPRHVTRAPGSLGPGEEAVTTKQELAHAMPGSGEVLLNVLPAAAEVPDRFLGLRGRANLREEVGSQELGELASISAVGLDARSRLHGRQGGSNHEAMDPQDAELTLEGIAGGPRLVATGQVASRLSQEPPGKAADRIPLVRLLPLDHVSPVGRQQGHLDRPLVNIEPDVCDKLHGHDRLLSYAALAPLALTRDRAWRLIRHPVGRPIGRLDLTTASRSFHTV